jgi:hypothetical protein
VIKTTEKADSSGHTTETNKTEKVTAKQ